MQVMPWEDPLKVSVSVLLASFPVIHGVYHLHRIA
jgi:hypothetical protein